MSDFDRGDLVRVISSSIKEHIGRDATVNDSTNDGKVVIYFGDQDEDEFVYDREELWDYSSTGCSDECPDDCMADHQGEL